MSEVEVKSLDHSIPFEKKYSSSFETNMNLPSFVSASGKSTKDVTVETDVLSKNLIAPFNCESSFGVRPPASILAFIFSINSFVLIMIIQNLLMLWPVLYC